MKSFIQIIIGLIACGICSGCGAHQNEPRVVIVNGELSVVNESRLDIFPVVNSGKLEDFGGVASGTSATIGFASVDNGAADVTWAEKDWNAVKRRVAFRFKVSPELADKANNLKFIYKGSNVWVLNFYGKSASEAEILLASVAGDS
jgi:hypothetical protein